MLINTQVNINPRKKKLLDDVGCKEKVNLTVFDYTVNEISQLRGIPERQKEFYVYSIHNPNIRVYIHSDDMDKRCYDEYRNIFIKPYKWVADVFFISPNDTDEIPFARFMVESLLGFLLDKDVLVQDPEKNSHVDTIIITNFLIRKQKQQASKYRNISFRKTNIHTGEVIHYDSMDLSDISEINILKKEQTVGDWKYEINYYSLDIQKLVKIKGFYIDDQTNMYVFVNNKFAKINKQNYSGFKNNHIKLNKTRIPLQRLYKQKIVLRNKDYNEQLAKTNNSIFGKCNTDVYKYYDPITNLTYYHNMQWLKHRFGNDVKAELYLTSINTFYKQHLKQ